MTTTTRTRWGAWQLQTVNDLDEPCAPYLEHERGYGVELSDVTERGARFWMRHLSEKAWVRADVLADFFEAITDLGVTQDAALIRLVMAEARCAATALQACEDYDNRRGSYSRMGETHAAWMEAREATKAAILQRLEAESGVRN